MKIEWTNKPVIPFSQVSPGTCYLDNDDDLCLACGDGRAVILATGEVFTPDDIDGYKVRLISAKVVVSEGI